MCFIHAYNEIIKLSQDISKGSSQCFFEFMEVKLCICLAVKDFANVEDKQLYL